ncbi:hypothetical protein B0H14DRAFT_3661995, partial [Mycena olivaceomarginata]
PAATDLLRLIPTLALARCNQPPRCPRPRQQDSHGVYFSAHEHLGYSLRFPDTSNTRYGCFSEAAAEVIMNLTVYRELMQFIRDRKMSLAYTNLEKNVWDAINDLRTLVELVVLLWYGQNFSKPVMRVVRSLTSTGGLPNLWDMGLMLEGVIKHCERVIADPDIIMGPNLSYETASMDGRPWERPEAISPSFVAVTLSVLLATASSILRAAAASFLHAASVFVPPKFELSLSFRLNLALSPSLECTPPIALLPPIDVVPASSP